MYSTLLHFLLAKLLNTTLDAVNKLLDNNTDKEKASHLKIMCAEFQLQQCPQVTDEALPRVQELLKAMFDGNIKAAEKALKSQKSPASLSSSPPSSPSSSTESPSPISPAALQTLSPFECSAQYVLACNAFLTAYKNRNIGIKHRYFASPKPITQAHLDAYFSKLFKFENYMKPTKGEVGSFTKEEKQIHDFLDLSLKKKPNTNFDEIIQVHPNLITTAFLLTQALPKILIDPEGFAARNTLLRSIQSKKDYIAQLEAHYKQVQNLEQGINQDPWIFRAFRFIRNAIRQYGFFSLFIKRLSAAEKQKLSLKTSQQQTLQNILESKAIHTNPAAFELSEEKTQEAFNQVKQQTNPPDQEKINLTELGNALQTFITALKNQEAPPSAPSPRMES